MKKALSIILAIAMLMTLCIGFGTSAQVAKNLLPLDEEYADKIINDAGSWAYIRSSPHFKYQTPCMGSWIDSKNAGEIGFPSEYINFDTETVKFGSKSIMLKIPSKTEPHIMAFVACPGDLFEAGKTYTFQAYVKTNKILGQLGAQIIVEVKNKDHATIDSLTVFGELLTGTKDWTLLSTTFTMPKSDEELLVNFNCQIWNCMSGTAWFDGLAVVEGNTPVDYASLAPIVVAGKTEEPTPAPTAEPTAVPTQAPDKPSTWAAEEVAKALEAGLVPDHINSKYQADITRSDFCDLIIKMIEKKSGKAIADVIAGYADAKTDVSFPDTDSANVIAAAKLGIVNGRSSGAFDPTANITRQEAAKMLALAAKVLGADITASEVAFADADDIYAWAKEFIYYVNTIGVMNGTSTTTPPNFSPLRTYTREQSILTVYRLFNYKEEPAEYVPRLSKIEKELGLDPYVPSYTVETPGLIVKGTKAYLNGEEFAEIGVNFFGGFLRAFENNSSAEYERIFKLFNEYGIKYCRVNMGMFWPVNYDQWEANKVKYIKIMDDFVAAAEKYEIGIIGSMFWNVTGINYHFDEHCAAWWDTSSKTYEYMLDYTELLVLRYNQSPSIWGWEFGNEMNLHFDIPGAVGEVNWEPTGSLEKDVLGQLVEKTLDDVWYSADMVPTMQAWAELVDELEPYGRVITTGNGCPRPSQWNQWYYGGSWSMDTEEEYKEISGFLTPAPFNAESAHIYDFGDRFFDPSYDTMIATYQRICNERGQVYFIGEFNGLNVADSKTTIDAIVKYNVPISCVWAIGDVEYSLDKEPDAREEVFSYIKQANEQMRAK